MGNPVTLCCSVRDRDQWQDKRIQSFGAAFEKLTIPSRELVLSGLGCFQWNEEGPIATGLSLRVCQLLGSEFSQAKASGQPDSRAIEQAMGVLQATVRAAFDKAGEISPYPGNQTAGTA